jgi:plastocyanin
MNRKACSVALGLFAVLVLLLLAGCSKKSETSNEKEESEAKPMTGPAGAGAAVDPSTVATVSGVVKFDGTAPKPVKIDMTQDPACKGTNTSENVVVDNGKLANVFVYVKEGADKYAFETPKDPVTIDQDGCKYHPHVLGVMTGQTVKIVNSDNTTHNIHPTPKDNREWNESQPPKANPIEKTFAREEIMLPVKCNQHPWMKMYVSVVKSPLFAVTDKSGKFEIKGLPPGTYTLAAVQEKLGTQTQQITVAPKDSKTVDFTFKEGAVGAAASGR